MVEIVPATEAMIKAIGEEPIGKTVYAIVVVDGARTLGVGGFYLSSIGAVAFSKVSDELKRKPRQILKAARMLLAMIRSKGLVAYAERDPKIETAASFLEHLGFKRFNEEIYVWRG